MEKEGDEEVQQRKMKVIKRRWARRNRENGRGAGDMIKTKKLRRKNQRQRI